MAASPGPFAYRLRMATGGTRTVRLETCADAAQAAEGLASALRSWGPERAAELSGLGFLRVEQPLENGDPLEWLHLHPVLLRIYWRGSLQDMELAGVGVCVEHEGPPLAALDELMAQVVPGDEGHDARLFGVMRFDPGRAPDEAWASFGRSRFHLPLLEMRRTARGSVLACNLKAGVAVRPGGAYDAQRRTALRALGGQLPTAATPPARNEAATGDEEAAWGAHVASLLGEIACGGIEKAVLARAVRRRTGEALDPIGLLRRMRTQQPEACHFLVQPSPAAAFVGASPEHLYSRTGRRVVSEALAGTRPRGPTPEHDSLLAGDLLASEKDRREHEHVHRHLVEQLLPHCERVDAGKAPELRSLPMMHHLLTHVEATLKPGVRDAALLAALHPTPAVCGTPTAAALALLRACEPFDRGLYAGPVGCFGREETEVAVAIRSALLRGDSVQLFAGAGIVAGSDPHAEWQETSLKMEAFERLLGASRAP